MKSLCKVTRCQLASVVTMFESFLSVMVVIAAHANYPVSLSVAALYPIVI